VPSNGLPATGEATQRPPRQPRDVKVRAKRRKGKAAGKAQAAPVEKAAAQTPGMLVEGEEAVELYSRQIVFNLAELEKQVEELREACARTKKLLREVA
jgi:hypothetical protein